MRRSVFVMIGLLLLAGCGPAGHGGGVVSGTITYKNQPVNGATLLLYPAAGGDIYTPIPVGQDGAFSTADVPPGDYKVVVQPSTGTNGMPPPPEGLPADQAANMKAQYDKMKTTPTIAFPDKYKPAPEGQPQTSPLTCTIKGGSQTLKLELSD